MRRRHIELDGAQNFRDLGGYETQDGRRVRWCLFYRSGSLAGLSDADLQKLELLGIKLVCDLRGPGERREQPDRLPRSRPAVAELGIFGEGFAIKGFRAHLESGLLSAQSIHQALTERSRLLATRFAPAYAAMFARISKRENLPALVHCSAGMDRAGFGSALLLTLLGVPRETVLDDYLLSNVYSAKKIERKLFRTLLESRFRADVEIRRSALIVDRAYLEAAFDEVEKQYHDFDSYRRKALGIDDAELEAFRAMALE